MPDSSVMLVKRRLVTRKSLFLPRLPKFGPLLYYHRSHYTYTNCNSNRKLYKACAILGTTIKKKKNVPRTKRRATNKVMILLEKSILLLFHTFLFN